MKIIKYHGLIPQNVATKNAKRIGVYDSKGIRVSGFGLQNLKRPKLGEKQYSFGALSDVHVVYETASEDFQRALTYLNSNEDVAFTCICGDLTNEGIQTELAQYKSIVDAYSPNTPVYAIAGNHEMYASVCKDFLQEYTGQPLYYSFTQGNDVFIMMGEYEWENYALFEEGQLQWFYETLEANRNKRCFVLFHVFPWGDSGNANYLYGTDLFSGTQGTVFQNLLKHYKNTILFHGHSHLKFDLQEIDKKANYSEALGYRSVHIPSLAVPRDLVDGAITNVYAESEGYVVDVYKNHVVLRGRDFVEEKFLPIATYCLDTTIEEIEANTFRDTTGITSRLPSGYTEVDYIEVTGTQYINTGFIPNQDTRVVIEFKYLGGTGVYGARSSVSSNNFSMRVINSKWQMGYGDGVVTGTIASDNEWHVADHDKNNLYIDGELASTRDYVEFTAPYPIAIGAIRAGSMYYGQGCYRTCKIYDNGVLVRHLVPCLNPNGESGMYDFVTESFYGNAGSGSIVAPQVNIHDGVMEYGFINTSTGEFVNDTRCVRNTNAVEVVGGRQIVVSNDKNYYCRLFEYDEDMNFIKNTVITNGNSYTVTLQNNTRYLYFRSDQANNQNDISVKYVIMYAT